jgi:aldose 1-epimerase
MTFRVEHIKRVAGGAERELALLSSADGNAAAEVWPGLGCNCLRWSVGGIDLLYVSPEWESNPVPTRSGNPVLFPFPNRIRNGGFTWAGRDYQLPINGPGGKHAIHGFACRKTWRSLGNNTTDHSAEFSAEFQGSIDAPESLAYWPADYRIRISVELRANSLAITAFITNPDTKPLPWGLGYHPYFCVPLMNSGRAEDSLMAINSKSRWELAENIPTGKRLPSDWSSPRRFGELALDDIFTDFQVTSDGLVQVGRIEQPGVGVVDVLVDAHFRELVVFTPPHRGAVCLEPYTCTTDAVNLQARGVVAGWQTLEPGESRSVKVQYRWRPTS